MYSAVTGMWRQFSLAEDTTNSNRQKYFRWVGILFQSDIAVLFTYQLCLRMSVFN